MGVVVKAGGRLTPAVTGELTDDCARRPSRFRPGGTRVRTDSVTVTRSQQVMDDGSATFPRERLRGEECSTYARFENREPRTLNPTNLTVRSAISGPRLRRAARAGSRLSKLTPPAQPSQTGRGTPGHPRCARSANHASQTERDRVAWRHRSGMDHTRAARVRPTSRRTDFRFPRSVND